MQYFMDGWPLVCACASRWIIILVPRLSFAPMLWSFKLPWMLWGLQLPQQSLCPIVMSLDCTVWIFCLFTETYWPKNQQPGILNIYKYFYLKYVCADADSGCRQRHAKAALDAQGCVLLGACQPESWLKPILPQISLSEIHWEFGLHKDHYVILDGTADAEFPRPSWHRQSRQSVRHFFNKRNYNTSLSKKAV